MKRLVLIVLASASLAHAQAKPTPLSAEKRDALQAYLACLYNRARDVDDGVSDTTSVAKVVARDCRAVLGTAVDAFTSGEPQASRDALYQEWLSKEVLQSTAAVTLQRQDRQATHAVANQPATAAAPSATQATAEAVPTPAPGQKHVTAKAVPRMHVAERLAPKPVPLLGPDGKPMSAWRRAYIAKHGHQPPKRP